jgi:hypothetical protein
MKIYLRLVLEQSTIPFKKTFSAGNEIDGLRFGNIVHDDFLLL